MGLWNLEAVEDVGEALRRSLGAAVVQLDQGEEQGGSFDQGSDPRAVHPALEHVALPVAGNEALVDLFGALVDSASWRRGRRAGGAQASVRRGGDACGAAA